MVKLYTDGGARGNPGPAGIGIVIVDNGQIVAEYGESIGRGTNNEAEYKALIKGLEICKEMGYDEVEHYSDSSLVVNQLNRIWQAKEARLRTLRTRIDIMSMDFKTVTHNWVRRTDVCIERADRLYNEAIEKGIWGNENND